MAQLSERIKKVITEQKLGFVATISADGTPNLSPKGTFLVHDDEHIMFAEIRSPNTVVNITSQPVVEVNFVDPFSRMGARVKGRARYISEEEVEYEDLLPRFQENWDDKLCGLFNGIVMITVESCAAIVSPAYDTGAKETELRKHYLKYFYGLQPKEILEVDA